MKDFKESVTDWRNLYLATTKVLHMCDLLEAHASGIRKFSMFNKFLDSVNRQDYGVYVGGHVSHTVFVSESIAKAIDFTLSSGNFVIMS